MLAQANKPTDSSRSIQVIGAGYSRTGTTSFTKALERLLGGPVCHSAAASLQREEGNRVQSWHFPCQFDRYTLAPMPWIPTTFPPSLHDQFMLIRLSPPSIHQRLD